QGRERRVDERRSWRSSDGPDDREAHALKGETGEAERVTGALGRRRRAAAKDEARREAEPRRNDREDRPSLKLGARRGARLARAVPIRSRNRARPGHRRCQTPSMTGRGGEGGRSKVPDTFNDRSRVRGRPIEGARHLQWTVEGARVVDRRCLTPSTRRPRRVTR